MIKGYMLDDGGLSPTAAAVDAIWIDFLEPTDEERSELTAILGFAAPTQEEQEEIELSSRLYMEHGAAVMTALLPAHTKGDQAEIGPVTFILTDNRLVTLRHHDPRPFSTFPPRAGKTAYPCDSPATILLGLLEDVIDRLADLTEYASRKIEALTASVFRPGPGKHPDLRAQLHKIGWRDALVTHIRDSLVTMERLLGFLNSVLDRRKEGKRAMAMVKSQLRDVRTISEQAGFLMQKTAFLLDAMMGLINIEQSNIIKIFSVVAVVFLPPTLVASIYGMNFEVMPELGWRFGYPAALVLMLITAVAPLMFFKRKGWF